MKGFLRLVFGSWLGAKLARLPLFGWGLKGLVVLALLLATAWSMAPTWVRAVVVLTVFALVALRVWRAFGGRRPQVSSPGPGSLPRTRGDMFWVYVLGEWRTGDGALIPLDEAPFRRDRVYHLVYVGYTCDWEQRLRQHAADKGWFHDNLVIDSRSRWYSSEADARRAEQMLIADAARSPFANERPRENRHHNPTFDERVSAEMRARA